VFGANKNPHGNSYGLFVHKVVLNLTNDKKVEVSKMKTILLIILVGMVFVPGAFPQVPTVIDNDVVHITFDHDKGGAVEGWPAIQHDFQRTGHTPEVLDPPLELARVFSTGESPPHGYWKAPVISEDILYFFVLTQPFSP